MGARRAYEISYARSRGRAPSGGSTREAYSSGSNSVLESSATTTSTSL